jgi:hypothetical protein
MMSWSFAMMQGPGVVAPLVWTIVRDVFPQSPQNVTNRIFHSPSGLVEQIPYA